MSATIVVGYDGEQPAQRALERAIEQARADDAELLVVSVAEMPLNPEGSQNFGTLDGSPPSMMPLLEPAELEPLLETARGKIEAAGLEADYVWAAGEPASAIVGAARDREAALIVLGSHHHGLLSRLMGGDVAAQVRKDAGCDVLVVE